MNLLVMLDSNAGPKERGYTGGKRYAVTVNGRELSRCTYVCALLGFGMAMFVVEKDAKPQIVNGCAVEGVTFGRIRVKEIPWVSHGIKVSDAANGETKGEGEVKSPAAPGS